MGTEHDKMLRMIGPVACVAAALLAAAGAVSLVSTLVGIGPRVGDILTFDKSRPVQPAFDARLQVARTARPGCVLDLDTLTDSGGSMILEARLSSDTGAFFLHWAGARTTSDAANCGSAADLIVDRRAMDILAMVAGGYGTGRKMGPTVGNRIPF